MEELTGRFREDDKEFDIDFPEFDPKRFYQSAEPSYSEDLIEIYQFFQSEFGLPRRVFYPCCDRDASPTRAFPKSEVIQLDISEDAVDLLKRHGIEALSGDVRKYRPEEKFDLLILLNPCIKTRNATHTIKRGGHIIANDYHGNTTQMLRNPFKYKFHGTIHHGKKPMKMLDTKYSKRLLNETNPFFNLYSVFTKKF
jgi:hypothetical protein